MKTWHDWYSHFVNMSLLEIAEIWEQHIETLHPELSPNDSINFRLDQTAMAEQLADLMINKA